MEHSTSRLAPQDRTNDHAERHRKHGEAKRQLGDTAIFLDVDCSVLLLVTLTTALLCCAQSVTPAENLDAVIANAKKNSDYKGERRATNLKFALRALKPSDIKGIRCGKGQDAKGPDTDQADDIAGKLLDKALEKYLPTLAAAIASAPAAAVTAFLTPARTGLDAVEILNQTDKFTQADVQNAARQMLQDTLPGNFKKLSKASLAKIVACSI